MNISPKTGKALDLSGAFMFLILAIASALSGNMIAALACVLAIVSALASAAAWRQHEIGHDVGFSVLRNWSALLAMCAGILFAVAIVKVVLA